MSENRVHPGIPKLRQQFADGKIERREFLRYATLLGLSASAAYAFVGKITGEDFVAPAQAALPQGGTIRIGMRVQEITEPQRHRMDPAVRDHHAGGAATGDNRPGQHHPAAAAGTLGGQRRPEDLDPAPAQGREMAIAAGHLTPTM